MLQIRATFTVEGYTAGDGLNVYDNVDARGVASGSIDTSGPANDSPIPLNLVAVEGPGWAEGSWPGDAWGGSPAVASVTYRTAPIHFGEVRLGGKSVDAAGNEQAAAINEVVQVVNSTPFPPAELRTDTVDGEGRQWFTFEPSPQLTGV